VAVNVGVFYLNPGSAGPRRFSLLRLRVTDDGLQGELVSLDSR
jgi:hypothetical protein